MQNLHPTDFPSSFGIEFKGRLLSWNPVVGCWGPGGTEENPQRCYYCYAHDAFRLFQDRGDPFRPKFWPERLDQIVSIKKPSVIYTCSWGDLFGDWIQDEWIEKIIKVANSNPQHLFQFITKNPKRLSQWNGYWSENCWICTTVTNQSDADERLPWLLRVDVAIRIVNHEPLLGEIDMRPFLHCDGGPSIQWALAGAMNGSRAPTKPLDRPLWIQSLIDQYRAAGVPLLIRDTLNWPERIQKFPKWNHHAELAAG